MITFKCRDNKTGLWFCLGRGFAEPCRLRADNLTAEAVAIVRKSHDGDVEAINEYSQGCTNCDCDECIAEGEE